MNVFDRIHKASQSEQGITLSALEVHVLMDLCGDAMAQAEMDLAAWRERLAEYERIADRQGNPVGNP